LVLKKKALPQPATDTGHGRLTKPDESNTWQQLRQVPTSGGVFPVSIKESNIEALQKNAGMISDVFELDHWSGLD